MEDLITAPDGRRAVVKRVPEASVDSAVQLDLWRRVRQLRHPNLIELLDCGQADHNGEMVVYAVFESPDDTLASALSRSPLDRVESREVLDSVLNALRYLHAQGLVLGALDADHIVAAGDRVKLTTDTLREADTSAAYREDVRLLGEFWQQALMAASPKSAEIAAHAADPNPLTRWTLAEISLALDPPLTNAPPVAEAPVSAPPAAVRNVVPTLPPPHRRTPEVETSNPFPKWILVGLAGVLLLVFGLHRTRPADVTVQSPVAPVSIPAENPAPAPIAKTVAPKLAVPAVARPSAAAGKEMWRVIAFTYRSRDAAAKIAHQLNEYHPGLNAAVFSPPDKKGYYLVSLGGRMTHEDAVRLQHSARGKGLPRDLYVQNYSR